MKSNEFIRKLVKEGRGYGYLRLDIPSKICEKYNELNYDHVVVVMNDDNSLTVKPF